MYFCKRFWIATKRLQELRNFLQQSWSRGGKWRSIWKVTSRSGLAPIFHYRTQELVVWVDVFPKFQGPRSFKFEPFIFRGKNKSRRKNSGPLRFILFRETWKVCFCSFKFEKEADFESWTLIEWFCSTRFFLGPRFHLSLKKNQAFEFYFAKSISSCELGWKSDTVNIWKNGRNILSWIFVLYDFPPSNWKKNDSWHCRDHK